MRQYALLLLFHLTQADFFNQEQCAIDRRSLENMWEQKLIHDLLKCNYDVFQAPAQNNSEPIRINLSFILKHFKFVSRNLEFSTYMWVFFKWYDERLVWDPKNYDGISSVPVMSSYIWVPGIKHFNGISDMYDERYLYIPCEVTSSGMVRCHASILFESVCGTDLSDWPYDFQNCSMVLGPYNETGVNILMYVKPKSIFMIGHEYGTEWDIMDYNQEIDQNAEAQLKMTFRLERHGDILAAMVIYPTLVLSALTFSVTFVDARRNIRLYIACFSVKCHFYYLSELVFVIPEHNKTSPRMLLYFRGSLIMTTIVTGLSFVLNCLCRKETFCPNWIISINNFVNSNYVKYIVWPRWHTEEGDKIESKFLKDWTDFSNIVNSVWTIVSIIVYVILYCVFMPHPIPITY